MFMIYVNNEFESLAVTVDAVNEVLRRLHSEGYPSESIQVMFA